MSRGCLLSLVLFALLVLFIGFAGVSSYNGLVSSQERIEAGVAQIDNVCQRRYDLVPQLVATVKGVADYERATLDEVVEARASVGRIQLPPDVLADPQAMEAYLAAQSQLGSALGRLFAVSESYPELRATEAFLTLQDQLEGSENRIATARSDFIAAVQAYNTARRRFPGNLIATLGGFERAETFGVDSDVRQAPTIDFSKDEG